MDRRHISARPSRNPRFAAPSGDDMMSVVVVGQQLWLYHSPHPFPRGATISLPRSFAEQLITDGLVTAARAPAGAPTPEPATA